MLRRRSELGVNASAIRITTGNSVVTLEGLVANAQERRAAEDVVQYTFGVNAVENRLELRA